MRFNNNTIGKSVLLTPVYERISPMLESRTLYRFPMFLLAIVLVFLPEAASAHPEVGATGTWTDCNVVTEVRQAGSMTLVAVEITETFAGTLAGSYVGTEVDRVAADGSATFTGNGVLTGSVAGRAGSIGMRYT